MESLSLWYPPKMAYTNEGGEWHTRDEVFCALCDSPIPLCPVPVVGNSFLCLDCLDKAVPDWDVEVPESIRAAWRRQMAAASE